mgnify:FL=1
MSEVTQFPIEDTEYCTPAQAAEIRAMRDDGWKEFEPIPNRQVTQADLDAQSPWMAYVEFHRRLNNTQGQESEE